MGISAMRNSRATVRTETRNNPQQKRNSSATAIKWALQQRATVFQLSATVKSHSCNNRPYL